MAEKAWVTAVSGLVGAAIGAAAAIGGGYFTELQKEKAEGFQKRCELVAKTLGEIQGKHFQIYDQNKAADGQDFGGLAGILYTTLPFLDDKSFGDLQAAMNAKTEIYKRVDNASGIVVGRLIAVSKGECGRSV
jgi:hypothetical protein